MCFICHPARPLAPLFFFFSPRGEGSPAFDCGHARALIQSRVYTSRCASVNGDPWLPLVLGRCAEGGTGGAKGAQGVRRSIALVRARSRACVGKTAGGKDNCCGAIARLACDNRPLPTWPNAELAHAARSCPPDPLPSTRVRGFFPSLSLRRDLESATPDASSLFSSVLFRGLEPV